MEVYIETLTGSAFELKVSPLETIMSVKAKIQRLEGIPVSQQHLIWQSKELEDDCSLQDYKITDGATLKLVIAMRGGPINTRKVPVEDPTWKELTEYMEANRDELWEKLPGGRQVTLLVFRDGDQINFFRVVDRGDGTVAPLAKSLSVSSLRSSSSDEKEEETVEQQRLKENHATMQKMKSIKKQMEALTIKKKPKKKAASHRLPSYASSIHSKAKSGPSFTNSGHPCRLPPMPTQRVPPVAQASSRAASPQRGRPRGASVISVVSRRPSQVLQHELEAPDEEVPLEVPPVMQVAATTLPSHGLPDLRTISRLHGEGVLRVETSCSGSDSEEMESPWHQSAWPASVLESGDVSHSDGRSNGSLPNGSLAMGVLSRRPLRNSPHAPHRTRTTLDDFEQLQQTLAKFDPRISVQSTPRSRMPSIPNGRTVLDGMGFLGRPLRREDRLALLENLETCRPRTSPELSGGSRCAEPKERFVKTLKGGGELHKTNRARGRNHDDDCKKDSSVVPKPGKMGNDLVKVTVPTTEKAVRQPPVNSENSATTTTIVPDTPKGISLELLHSENSSRSQQVRQGATVKLPSIRPVRKEATPRCQVCKRKMGLTSNYSCRCGKKFCATHRYAEMHDCTYDYKSEGRKFLEQSNPLVIAPKLPKI